jgi:hypothetical protein
VDTNGKAMNFRMVVVKPYHRDESTESPIDPNTNKEDSTENSANDNWTLEETQPMKRRRGQSSVSKNKPKITNTSIAMDNIVTTVVYLSAKE